MTTSYTSLQRRGSGAKETCATALSDRTVHHADVIAIEGESYRHREAEADKKTRRGSRGKKDPC